MILINEWLPNPDGADADGEWIELWNNGAEALNIKGWALQPGSGKKYVLRERIIAPGGYATVHRSESKISLKNTGGEITLYDPSGAKRDTASFVGSAPSGLSYSRGEKIFSFVSPTPGAKNIVPETASMSASIAENILFPSHAPLVTVVALALAVGVILAYTAVLTIKKDETLSKLFFG
jgi:hypothetical protein